MRSNKSLLNVLTVAAIFSASFAACVKKREDINAQGANIEKLVAVKDVESWKHTITTGESLDNAAISEADKLTVETTLEQDKVKFPKVVTFDTNSPLLKPNISAIDMFGEPNTTYQLVYKLTPNFLKIYKLVPKKQLSHYEEPYALKEKGGDFLVPIGGYNATYYKVEKARNTDNKETNVNQKSFVPADDFKTANSVEINFASFTTFKKVDKLDVLPAEYFTKGEWYYASSIISTKPGEEQKIGYVDGSVDASLRKLATKIKFSKINNFLRGINVVKDDRVAFNEDQADDVLNIRVDWEDYRTAPFGRETGLTEEKYNLRNETDRTFGKFHFSQTVILAQKSQEESFLEGVFKGIKVDSLTIRPNSFSYTLIKTSTGEKIKYSFLRVSQRDYDKRVYYKYDRKKFGFFPVEKFKLSDHQDHREGDVEKNILMSRYNPKKDIYFKFSTLTPKMEELQKDPNRLKIDYRTIGAQVVNQWNRAFQLAGAKSQLKILEGDAELGELDINIINIIDNIGGAGLLGVGPTVADPETGEVISGTVNVYVGPLINSASDDIRDYIKIKAGIAKDVGFSKQILNNRPLFNYISMEVEHFCPEVKTYAISVKGIKFRNSEKENVFVNKCIEKMLPKRVASVVSHEMGHSPFALRHNFFGSSDKANSFDTMAKLEQIYPRAQFPEIYKYYPNEKFLPAGSSIMDYSPYAAPFLVMPGTYDIASIAYGYAGKLESKNTRTQNKPSLGTFVSFDMNKPLDELNAFQTSNTYKYCTDEHVDNFIIDPLCKRHDYGYTPMQALDYYFNQYRDYLVLYGQKLDRNAVANFSKYRLSFLNGMAEIYAGWRAYVHDYVGEQKTYLDHISKNDKEAFETELKNSATFKHKEYIGVSEKYYDLLSEILFLPDMFCVAVSADKRVKLMEFEKLQKEVIGAKGVDTVFGCDDASLVSYIKETEGLDVITSIGLPVNNIQFSLAIENAEEAFDIFGLGQERGVTGSYLTGRVPPKMSYLLSARNGLAPSAMDEAYLYEKLREKLTTRLLSGMDVRHSLANNLQQLKLDIKAEELPLFKKFDSEWSIFGNTLAGLINSSIVPGKPQRPVINDFLIGKTNTKTGIDPGSNVYSFNGTYYFAKPEAVFVNKVFEKLTQLDQPLFVNLSGASFAQQQAFKNFLGVVKSLPVSGGKVSFDALQKMFVEWGKLQQSTTNPEEATALANGTVKLAKLLEAVSIQFAAAQSGQTEFKVPNSDVVVSAQTATQFVNAITTSADVTVEIKKYLSQSIALDQKTIVSEYVKSVGADTYTAWEKQTTAVIAEMAKMDEDERLDVQIQSENLRGLLGLLPGAK